MSQQKTRSSYALDALNFCNAGIQTGLGPFMAIFYTAVRHWHPGQIGTLMAFQSVAGIGLQPFTGRWVDESHHKKLMTAIGAFVVVLGALGIVLLPAYEAQVGVQLMIGMAVTIFPAVTGAFALGLTDQDQLSGRVARNETFTHTGNVIFAVAAGLVGTLLALQGVFIAAAVFAAGMIPSVWFIEEKEVNYEAARGGGDEPSNGEEKKRRGWKELAQDKTILTFTACIVLYYCANAATLPLVSEILTKGNKTHSSAWQVSAMVVVAEVAMVLVALICGKLADQWGRKPLLLVGFGVLALRNVLTIVSHDASYLIGLQALDGVAMGIYGVLLTLITADIAKGSGRFNLVQGAVQSAMGLGGVLSNVLFGWIAKGMGFNSSFVGLSLIAVAGGVLSAFRMPETKPDRTKRDEKAAHA